MTRWASINCTLFTSINEIVISCASFYAFIIVISWLEVIVRIFRRTRRIAKIWLLIVRTFLIANHICVILVHIWHWASINTSFSPIYLISVGWAWIYTLFTICKQITWARLVTYFTINLIVLIIINTLVTTQCIAVVMSSWSWAFTIACALIYIFFICWARCYTVLTSILMIIIIIRADTVAYTIILKLIRWTLFAPYPSIL